jgi:acetyltransferase-like isoleucine patch superfamily enzyme
MWWAEVAALAEKTGADPRLTLGIHPDAKVEAGAILDESRGPISVGADTRVCAGAKVSGPVIIGEGCLVGNAAVVRGPVVIENGARIGYAVELKNCRIGPGVAIGPMCFVADSLVEEEAYLGAMVRTSNERLDRRPISAIAGGRSVATGLAKLGCRIGARSALGIQCIVLPGREIQPGTIYEPRVTVTRNLPAGRYRVVQSLEAVNQEIA